MDVTISIVNFDTKDIISECLASIFEHTKDIDFEVIVVDNGSTDGSIEFIKSHFPKVKLICNNKNEGFGAAHNKSFHISNAKYFVVLNSDVIIKTNVFRELKDFMEENPDIALVVPKVVYPTGDTQDIFRFYPGIKETILGALYTFNVVDKERFFKYSTKNCNYDEFKILKNEYAMGCCYFLRRSSITEPYLFDEKFSLVYSEDADLCFRLKKQNFKIAYYPKVSVIHYSGYTVKSKKKYDYSLYKKIRISFWKNKFYFVRKHHGFLKEAMLRIITAMAFFVALFFNLVGFIFKKNKLKSKHNLQIYWSILVYTVFSKPKQI